MKLKTMIFALALIVINSFVFGAGPEVGDEAPDFTLPYATADTINFDGVTLSDYFGKQPVILAFYPADFSPGCTTEMCNIRDNFAAFNNLNAAVLGISNDNVFAHQAWIKQEGFQFKLLTDNHYKVAKMYDSYNKKYGMHQRTVYVIDQDGKITYKNLKYKTGNAKDFSALKEAIAKLGESENEKM